MTGDDEHRRATFDGGRAAGAVWCVPFLFFLFAGFAAACAEGVPGDGSFGTDASAELTLEPERLQFPTVQKGESTSLSLTITNSGSAPLRIDNMELREGDEDDIPEFQTGENWPSKADFPVTVEPDGSYETEVAYAPQNDVHDSGEVVLETNALEANTATVPIESQALNARLRTPGRIDFGDVYPGEHESRDVTLDNTGSASLALSDVRIEGSEQFQVTVPEEGSSGGDGGGPTGERTFDDLDSEGRSIPPNGSFRLRVWFSPTENARAEAELTVETDEAGVDDKVIPVVGRGASPCLDVNPEGEVDFERVAAPGGAARSVTIENCRPEVAPLEVSDVRIEEDGDDAFEFESGSLPDPLPDDTLVLEGEDRTSFGVAFTPTEPKDYEATLVIESNDPAREVYEVTLAGTGFEATDPDPDPDPCSGVDEQVLATEDFEGTDPGWSKHFQKTVTSRPGDASVFDVEPDASPAASGDESGSAFGDSYGTCGYGGLAKEFSFSVQPDVLRLQLRLETDPWGRGSVILKDSSGYHVVWERKGAGSSIQSQWTEETIDISSYDSEFTLIIGNADRSTPWCHNVSDHGWQIWADDVSIETRCDGGT